MDYVYRHFIPQNTAPKGAKRIGIYDGNGKKVCNIPLGTLAPPTGTKLYSFGLLSDIHLYKKGVAWVNWNPDGKFDDALSFFESQGCAFCAHCGDFTQTGLYDEGDKVNIVPDQFAYYKEICDKHAISVYGCCGNHESYVVPIVNNPNELVYYTGTSLHHVVTQGNDLFIFLGQPNGNTPMSDEALQFLQITLEANPNKRCFVFVHPHLTSGNPLGAYAKNPLFQNWHGLNAFKGLLNSYPKTVLFHGHTHVKFECQEQDDVSTYSNADGFHSVHVPSLSTPRDVVVNQITHEAELINRTEESQGYIVDVYDDCIVLNGWDFIGNKPVSLGTYKIDTV